MKKIAFHSNQLSIRGTEVALFQYAKYNEEILGNKSVIFTFPNKDMGAFEKFKERYEKRIENFRNYLNSGESINSKCG
jgi:Fe-S oxidoreductase